MTDVDVINHNNLKDHLPESLSGILDKRDGAAIFHSKLPEVYSPTQVSPRHKEAKTVEQRIWEIVGNYYRVNNRPHEALAIYSGLYDHMLSAQEAHQYRVRKGMPLVWMSECFLRMGYLVHAKRYLMLTLVEDAIYYEGKIDPEISGIYFRLVWQFGLADGEIKRYSEEIYDLSVTFPSSSLYPEWVLHELDQLWMIEFPTLAESSAYFINPRYARNLIKELGNSDGKVLERLTSYLLSCVPGWKASTRRKSKSTDYDVVCSVEGLNLDFRSDLGRYFVCECKDLESPADFTTIAKFCRVLDSTKSKFGMLISTKGITGKNKGTDAEREQIKVYQDRGLVIVVVDKDDLNFVANGGNFIGLIRDRYETVRLDLEVPKSQKPKIPCAGVTSGGNPCKRNVSTERGYCWQHKDQATETND